MRAAKHLVVLLVLSTSSLILAEDPVHFADANLKAAVEDALGVTDPTPADMLGLFSLIARSKGITDLPGLEFGTNLQELYLYGNQISDISALSGLTNLRWLDLDNNQISDISAVAGLTSLTWLDLDDNQINDISALARLSNLTWLDLDSNLISDIPALSGLDDLTCLDLGYNQISDVSALSGLTKLERLGLENNQISDISTLSRQAKLGMLWMHDNPLNQEACDIYAPQIISNNPGIDIRYDPCANTQYALNVSATAGGSVATPGEGSFSYDDGTEVAVTAVPADACHYFAHWTGTAVDAGTVDDPSAPNTFLTVAGNHTLKANFRAETIYVDDDAPLDPGPNDLNLSDPHEDGTEDHPFDSIQEAIDAVSTACRPVVFVRTGTYGESVNFIGKNIRVTGIDPASTEITAFPIIAANDTSATVTFNHAEDPTCQLSGFVLSRAPGKPGCAIECLGSSPTIRNCLIVGNRGADTNGAIIHCEHSYSLFENLTVCANASGGSGSAFRFTDCDATITNSIIWGNTPNEITVASGNDPTVMYCDVQGTWPGPGNIDSDPVFALSNYRLSPDNPNAIWKPGDYHLLSETGRWNPVSLTWIADEFTSPCIDAGDPGDSSADEPRPHGARINMGVYAGTNQASCSPLLAPMTALWTFDESSGKTAYDAMGDNHGTVYGAAWTEGILDRALEFDGVDDYVDCGNDPTLAPDLFTLSVWIYPQATSASRTILRKAGGDTDKDYEFELFAARNPTFSFGNGVQTAVLYSSSKLSLGEWTHIGITRDETEAAIYVNGTQLMSQTYDFVPLATDHSLIIGGGSLQPYKGRIDDVGLYDSALSIEEIENLVTKADL